MLNTARKLGLGLTLSMIVVFSPGCPENNCQEDVWIQAVSSYRTPSPMTIAVSTFASMCDEFPSMTVVGGGSIEHVAGDPEEGHTMVYTVLDGPLKDQSVSCNIHAKALELTYARMHINVAGELECSCGFVEFYDPDGDGVDNPERLTQCE